MHKQWGRIRINYWDGDVCDRPTPSNMLVARARKASLDIKADVDAITADNTVIATFRNGQELQ